MTRYFLPLRASNWAELRRLLAEILNADRVRLVRDPEAQAIRQGGL
jgi:hypothetical protein